MGKCRGEPERKLQDAIPPSCLMSKPENLFVHFKVIEHLLSPRRRLLKRDPSSNRGYASVVVMQLERPKTSWVLKIPRLCQRQVGNCLRFASFFFFLLSFFGGVLHEAYGSSQARDQIRAIAAGLCHSHSNARSELRLGPTPQLMATLDSQPTEWAQESNLHPHGY